MLLRELAHVRTGDKGDTSQISVIAYDPAQYDHLLAHITAAAVGDFFGNRVRGAVTRHELPGLGALSFVLERALCGGVTRSLALDPHGKCLGTVLLGMDVPAPFSSSKDKIGGTQDAT